MKRRDFTLAALASPLLFAGPAQAQDSSKVAAIGSSRGQMAIQTTYSQALATDSVIGANYRYFIELPGSAVLVSGPACRFRFKAPASGSMSYAAVYAGKKGAGTGSFDGNQVQLTVNGQSTWTISSGQEVWSDPVSLALTQGDAVVVRYDGLGGSGKNYRWQNGLAAAFGMGWLSGLGGAANGGDTISGFTTVTGRSASVSAIEVGELSEFSALPSDPPEDPPPEENPPMSTYGAGMAAIAADQMFSSGNRFEAVPGQRLHWQFVNHSSGLVYLHQIDITVDENAVVFLNSGGTDLGWPVVPSACNLRIVPGAPNSVAKLHSGASASIVGNRHAVFQLRGNSPKALNTTPYPMVLLPPGRACILVLPPDIGATVDFHWQELPAA